MVSVAVQQAVVSATMNSILIEILLYGMYAAVYTGTVYIYLSRKSPTNWCIVASITSLFIIHVIKLVCNWKIVIGIMSISMRRQNPLATSYLSIVYDNWWFSNINTICGYPIIVISDGLMIWRCYKVWGNSWRLISLPVFLVFTEAALYITSAIIDFGPFFHTQTTQNKSMSLELPGLLIGFVNTVISALLIFYRIYSVSRNNSLLRSGRQYTRILYILTESSALYVIGVLLYAIPTAFPITDGNVRWQQGWTWYSNPIFSFSSGMAPTLMVACVSLAGDNDVQDAPSREISSFMFHARSMHVYLTQSVTDG